MLDRRSASHMCENSETSDMLAASLEPTLAPRNFPVSRGWKISRSPFSARAWIKIEKRRAVGTSPMLGERGETPREFTLSRGEVGVFQPPRYRQSALLTCSLRASGLRGRLLSSSTLPYSTYPVTLRVPAAHPFLAGTHRTVDGCSLSRAVSDRGAAARCISWFRLVACCLIECRSAFTRRERKMSARGFDVLTEFTLGVKLVASSR
eukprot:scaffold92041_cov36-Tisochrysis_lutea.AAC.1